MTAKGAKAARAARLQQALSAFFPHLDRLKRFDRIDVQLLIALVGQAVHWLDEPEGVPLLKEALELLLDQKQMRAMFGEDGSAAGAPWWRYVPDGADPAGSMAIIRAAQDKAWNASRLQRRAEKRDGGADRRPGGDT